MSLLVPLQIGAIQGLLMAGAVLSFVIAFRLLGFPDLTIEGAVPLGAGVYAVFVHHGVSLGVAAALACMAGAAAGATTAFVSLRFRVNKLLAGIIVVSIIYSLTLRVMSGPNISLLQAPSLFAWSRHLFGDGKAELGILAVLGLFWALVGGLLVAFFRTRRGIQLRAAGSNPRLSESLGVAHRVAIVAGLAGCNAMAALSGLLLADHQGFADVSLGQGVLILALAAMALGEAIVPDRKLRYSSFVVVAGILGSITYQVIVAYAVRAGLAPTDLRLATGVLVLLVVAFQFTANEMSVEDLGALQ